MTEKKPTGGPAFPQLSLESSQRDGHGDLIEPYTAVTCGMTMRQWYAGQALAGFLAGNPEHQPAAKGTAEVCFNYADAMIAHEAGEK